MKSAWAGIPLALLVSAGALVVGEDSDFRSVVNGIQSHYGVRPTSVPLFGLVNGFVKLAHPAGARGMKLAIFEGLQERDGARFQKIVREELGAAWKPVVRTRFRGDGEWTAIYARENRGEVRLLVATYAPGEATVVETKVDPKTMAKWLDEPDRMGRCGVKLGREGAEGCPDD